MKTIKDAIKSNNTILFLFITFALVLTASNAIAETPIIVDAPALNRDANLVVNGSFEEGHPGDVDGPPVYHDAPDTVYWALVDGGNGTHDPFYRGDLSNYPGAEMTPPGWTGSGGLNNYAEWLTQYPPLFLVDPVGPAISTAPSDGLYSLYFGNFYVTSIDVPQDQITITADGEWIFRDENGTRVDPVIVPGQDYDPEVRLSQTVTGLCVGATYRLSFTAFGELGHPLWELIAPHPYDGFFGLEMTGYDTLYLTIPSGSGLAPSPNYLSPFGDVSDHKYTVELVAPADTVDLTFINWGHWDGGTLLGGTAYVGERQTNELVLDDVILNGATICQDGVGTPGYWKTHPEAWPFDTITIGGTIYTKEQAIALMEDNDSMDVTYIMFRSLVSAKLNEWAGNDSSCVESTIKDADEWMEENTVGSDVKASGRRSPWRNGEPLYLELDDYNNGLLCAPLRT